MARFPSRQTSCPSVRGGARVLSGSMLGWGDDSSRPREALRDEVLAWIPTAS